MAWYLAKSLEVFRKQANAVWPTRSKASDGTIGDTAHSARTSDHNPTGSGQVCAFDLTHDPGHGVDSYHIADLVLRDQDKRLKYVISHGRIGSGPKGPQPGVWRKYSGANAHNHHMHISVHDGEIGDGQAPWKVFELLDEPAPTPEPYVPPRRTIKRGATGPDVVHLQELLKIDADGKFGVNTQKCVVEFQKDHKLTPDGVVGPATWDMLEQKK